MRAADAAGPRANVGGFSGKGYAPTIARGRRRRAADAIVSPWLWQVARKRAVGAGDGLAFGFWPRRAGA